MRKEKSLVIPDEVVMNKIYLIRNHKVMLDRDLAELYGVKAIRLREQVKRNQERFPENFMFQLTEKEGKTWYRKMRYHQNSTWAVTCPMHLPTWSINVSQCFEK
jgi:hypothetical protein